MSSIDMPYSMVVLGTIVTPDGIFDQYIGINDGKISVITKDPIIPSSDRDFIDATGMYVFPGFIDPHVHCWEHPSGEWNRKETFDTATKAAAQGGVTTIANMPNTPEPPVSVKIFEKTMKLAGKVYEFEGSNGPISIAVSNGVDILQYAGMTMGNSEKKILSNLDPKRVRELDSKGSAGYKIFTDSVGNLNMDWSGVGQAIDALVKSGTKKPVTFHCEDPRILEARVKERKHILRRPPECELGAVNEVVETCYAKGLRKINLAHISAEVTIDYLVNFLYTHPDMSISMEITPHHLLFNSSHMHGIYEKVLQMNPALRDPEDQESLFGALFGKFRGVGLPNNLTVMIGTDHAPHLLNDREKFDQKGMSGVPNLDTYGMFVSWLFNKGLNPQAIANYCSNNPAQLFGLYDRGEIVKGKKADLTIMQWEPVKINGKLTDEFSNLMYQDDSPLFNSPKTQVLSVKSRCGWSPYEGYLFLGHVAYTIKEGKVVYYSENKLKGK